MGGGSAEKHLPLPALTAAIPPLVLSPTPVLRVPVPGHGETSRVLQVHFKFQDIQGSEP